MHDEFVDCEGAPAEVDTFYGCVDAQFFREVVGKDVCAVIIEMSDESYKSNDEDYPEKANNFLHAC